MPLLICNFILEVLFMNKSGNFTSNLSGSLKYMSFRPAKLPPDPSISIDDEKLSLLTNVIIS